MQLFERVKLVSEQVAPSQTALGKALGLSQSKFTQYLNAVSEKNLWQYLPRILEVYPQISRDWLYFGEGEMLLPEGHGPRVVARPHRAVVYTPGRMDEENPRVRELEERVRLQQELLEAKDRIISLLSEKQAEIQGVFPLKDTTAPTSPGVVPSVRPGSDRG